MKNQYTARALNILANYAKYIEVPGGGLYHVNVGGNILADEDTYALRKKIEKALEEIT